MTFGSLFSGIGGMDLGLERAGLEVRWQIEIDPFCQRVLEKHWPNVNRYGDIRELDGSELERVDCIAGGFPCQDVSSIGKRAGMAGERSGLWTEYARIVCIVRPRFVLVENVTGLFARGIGAVLGDLAQLGFDAEWDVLPACAFGAPHPRARVFVVAYPAGERLSSGGVLSWATKGLSFGSDRSAIKMGTWPDGPENPRMVNGIPDRMDRVKSLGNAVIPQVAEWIGKRLLDAQGT